MAKSKMPKIDYLKKKVNESGSGFEDQFCSKCGIWVTPISKKGYVLCPQCHKVLGQLGESFITESRRICAWCKTDMGEHPGDKDTHGICPSCKSKMEADVNRLNQKPQASPAATGEPLAPGIK